MKTMQRKEAIDLLRRKCVALVDDEHSLCDVAQRLHILCGGFQQWSFGELKDRYDWIVKRRPNITRAQLEDLANRWQVARRFVHDEALACDNQLTETYHRTCKGWDEFDEADLARFVEELTGEAVEVVPDEETTPETPGGRATAASRD